jgi:ADP-ribose pyrophosphatase YjhB (NUDIX family)
MSRLAIIPLNKIPSFCPTCGHPVPEEERRRQTIPFKCSNPNIPKPHLIFLSPNPVAAHILFVRLSEGGLGVALGRRGLSYEVAFGKWALPGGFTEAETGAEAAVSEFKEELNVDVSDISVRHVAEYYDPNTFCAIHFYAGLWPHAEPPKLEITRESSEVQICPVSSLPDDLAFPYQADVIRKAAELFAS